MEYTNNLLKQIIALKEENEQLKLRLSGVSKSFYCQNKGINNTVVCDKQCIVCYTNE